MSKRSKRKNTRQSDFKVVVRGVRRDKPEYSRLMRATLEHFQALRYPVAETTPIDGDQRPSSREEKP